MADQRVDDIERDGAWFGSPKPPLPEPMTHSSFAHR
jgi:hypothetical protein